MSGVLETLSVNVVGDISDIENTFSNLEKSVTGLGSSLQSLGGNLTSMGGTLTTHVTAPILAMGAGMIVAADQIDSAYDTIRVGTGATGESLIGLQDDFHAVFGEVPASADQVGTAIADLNTRLGLTGEPLQQMTTQFLELSRITGSDVATNIESVTRVFGDWGISADQQSEKLDYLFKVSQATGIGIDALSQQMVQYGAPLRQMGFDYDTAAALVGKFNKEGVNSELVMGSLRIALGKMAKEGITDANQALELYVEQIKNAGSAGEANAIAIEVFGARAGPDMAAAIREGRFEVEDLVATLQGSPETILTAADATKDLSEMMSEMKAKVIEAVEPLGTSLRRAFESLEPFINSTVDAIAKVVEWFTNLPGPAQAVIALMVGLAAAIGPVLVAAGILISSVGAIVGALGAAGLGGALTAVVGILTGPVAIAIAAFAAAAYIIYKNWDTIGPMVSAVFDKIRTALQPLIDQIQTFITGALERLRAWWATNGPAIQQAAITVFEKIGAIINWLVDNVLPVMVSMFQKHFDTIVSILTYVGSFIGGVISLVANLINGDWNAAWTSARNIVGVVWDGIKALVSGAINAVLSTITSVLSAIQNTISSVWNAILSIIGTVLNSISSTVSSVWGGISSAIMGALAYIRDNARAAWDTIHTATSTVLNSIRTTIQTIWAGIQTTISTALTTIRSIIQNIWAAISELITNALNNINNNVRNIWTAILSTISGIINTIRTTIQTVWNAILETVSSVLNTIRTTVSTVWDAIQTAISTALNTIRATVSTIWNAILTTVSTVLNSIRTTATTIWNGILSTITTVLNSIRTTSTTIWNSIQTSISTALNSIRTTASTIWNSILTTITTVLNNIRTTSTTIWNNIQTSISNALNSINTIARSTWATILSTITSALNTILSTVRSTWATIESAVRSAMNTVESTVRAAWNNVLTAARNALSAIVTAVSTEMGRVVTAVTTAGGRVVTSLRTEFDKLAGIARSALQAVVTAVSSFGTSLYNAATTIGSRFVTGLTEQLNRAKTIFNQLTGLGSSAPSPTAPTTNPRTGGSSSGGTGRAVIRTAPTGDKVTSAPAPKDSNWRAEKHDTGGIAGYTGWHWMEKNELAIPQATNWDAILINPISNALAKAASITAGRSIGGGSAAGNVTYEGDTIYITANMSKEYGFDEMMDDINRRTTRDRFRRGIKS